MLPSLVALALAAATSASTHGSESWGRFRGPNGTGFSSSVTSIPDSLDPESHWVWKVETAPGYSSPVLSKDHVFLTGYEGKQLFTLCIDRSDGSEIWRRPAPTELPDAPKGPNSPVSPSPATDGENVYVLFGHFGLVSYDAQGEERWRMPLAKWNAPYGVGTSPVLVDDLLVLQADQDTGSYLLAVDKDSGEVRWRVDRKGLTHGFSSPAVYRPAKGPAEILVSSSYRLSAYSAADGAELWFVDGMAWQSKTVPVVAGDLLLVSSWMAPLTELGIPRVNGVWEEVLAEHDKDGDGVLSKAEAPHPAMAGLWFLFDIDDDDVLTAADWEFVVARNTAKSALHAIQLGEGPAGDRTATHERWKFERVLPNIPSPVVVGDVVHVLKEGGVLAALDLHTGEVRKQGRVEGAEDSYFASPVAAGHRLLTASQHGQVAVLEAGADWEVVSVSDFGEEIWSTPALADDQIFLRTQAHLYCFESED